MKSIRLDEWALSVLNETIRADAEFQINQRSAWQEFAREPVLFNGVDITAGIQRQRNLMMDELSFEFRIVPEHAGFWNRLLDLTGIRKFPHGTFYRLKKEGETKPGEILVKMVVKRDNDNRYRSQVSVAPEEKKPEEIHVTGIAR